MLGKALPTQSAEDIRAALSARGGEGGTHLSYAEAEMVVLREAMDTGCIPSLSDG